MAGIQFPCPRWPRSKCPTSHSIGYCYLTIILFLLHLSLTAAQSTDIFQPPVITEPDRQQTLYYAEKRKVKIQCTANGKPTPVYTWKKDGKMITENRYILFDTKSGLLTINSFTFREEGIYVCLSTNVVGGSNMATSESQPQTLKAIRVEPFKPPTEPIDNTFTVSEYSYISLKCSDRGTVVGPTDDISYNWYINTDSSQVLMDGGRLYISIDGSLHFTYTLRQDEFENENSYHCGIGSNSLQLIQIGNPVFLKVQEATPKAIRANIVYTNNGLQATVATSAELECIVSGYDPIGAVKLPVIRWYDDAGVEIKSDGIKYTLKHNNRMLMINDVQEMDEKAYECQGTTRAGSSRRAPVFLNVTAPPIWVEAPMSTTVPEGVNVVINCNARSLVGEQPPHQPQWKINGRNFEEVRKDNVEVLNDRKSMTFNSVTKDKDILCVQCFVQNSVGQTMGEACINVILPITLKVECAKCNNQPPEECNCLLWDISRGDSIQVRFIETTDPAFENQLTHQWSVHGTVYKEPVLPPFMKYDSVDRVYTLSTDGLTDKEFANVKGRYMFKVYHPYDSQNVTINVVPEGFTPAPVTSSAGVDMWIIGFVIGLIFLLAVIIIIIVFIVCRKIQEGVYNLGKKETNAGLDPDKELKDKNFKELSVPKYEDLDFPDPDKKKMALDLEEEDGPIGADDESLGEYGMEGDTYFNEDGSFIGNYSIKPVKPTVPNRPIESTI